LWCHGEEGNTKEDKLLTQEQQVLKQLLVQWKTFVKPNIVHKNARHGENWHYHKIIIVMGNDYFFPTKFVTFLREKLGIFLNFFVFLVQVWLIFLFFLKNHQNSLYHKIGNKKKWKENPGQVRSDTTKKRPLHCCAWLKGGLKKRAQKP
jgi:hypothetical protein